MVFDSEVNGDGWRHCCIVTIVIIECLWFVIIRSWINSFWICDGDRDGNITNVFVSVVVEVVEVVVAMQVSEAIAMRWRRWWRWLDTADTTGDGIVTGMCRIGGSCWMSTNVEVHLLADCGYSGFAREKKKCVIFWFQGIRRGDLWIIWIEW